jgi:hypothetical protein
MGCNIPKPMEILHFNNTKYSIILWSRRISFDDFSLESKPVAAVVLL